MSLILGIESSCDECSASVVRYTPEHCEALSCETFSQIDLHRPYGGVVPEIASRNHLETIIPMIDAALKSADVTMKDIDAVAVTNRPGLVGALLVGVSAAKSLAYAFGKPLVPVHHLEGHLCSIYLNSPGKPPVERNSLEYPLMTLLVSGGHSQLHAIDTPPEIWTPTMLETSRIGRSRDDAAGEAFDKTAKILGLPYPGGRYIDELAKTGDAAKYAFPRALPQKDTLDFSFSGLKTAVLNEAQKLENADRLEEEKPNLCASLQQAIIDALISKMELAIRRHRSRTLSVVGGVAANSRFRAILNDRWKSWGLSSPPVFPSPEFCTDNAAMIAAAGAFRYRQGLAIQGEQLLCLNAFSSGAIAP